MALSTSTTTSCGFFALTQERLTAPAYLAGSFSALACSGLLWVADDSCLFVLGCSAAAAAYWLHRLVPIALVGLGFFLCRGAAPACFFPCDDIIATVTLAQSSGEIHLSSLRIMLHFLEPLALVFP